MAKVQQVTTRSKAKMVEWEEQDEIGKETKEWVAKANAVNVERMRQDVAPATIDAVIPSEVDPIWEALANYPIMLTMSKLLNLVQQFRQVMESRLQTPHKVIPTLFTGPPPRMRTDEKKRLAIRSQNFCLLQETLYHKGSDGIWRRCIRSDEKKVILREARCGIAGGHYAGEAMAHKVWQAGLWWPMTQRDAKQYC
mgnify:CR=1 FL=1